jgi:predicted ArsR family transcriptional regulator
MVYLRLLRLGGRFRIDGSVAARPADLNRSATVHLVRKHILEILKECSGATVAELAESLNMAPVSVRHHLDILQGDNLICVDRLARTGSVGRPQQVYALTPAADAHFPDNFAALASGLLRQLRQMLPPDRFEAALKAMAKEFTAPLGAASEHTPLTEERLDQIVDFLNEHGYLARWERERSDEGKEDAEPSGSVFLLHKCNCPYAGIAAEHHELCIMDQALIDHLVGQPSVRIQSLANGGPCCTYRIVQPTTKPIQVSRTESVPIG